MINPISKKDSDLVNVLQNISQGVSYFDEDLFLIFANSRCVDLLELPDDLLRAGTHLSEVFRYNAERGEYGDGDIEVQVQDRVDLAMKFEPHVFERTRPDGIILRIEGKKVAEGGFVTTYSDVTELRSAQNDLENLNKRLDSLVDERTKALNIVLESTKHGISLVDRDLNAIVINKQCQKILDLPDRLIKPGTKFSEIMRYNAERGEYGEGDVEELVKVREELAKKFEAHSFIRDRGDGMVIEVTGRPVEIGFVTTFTDITEYKELERQLRRANEELESRVRERTLDLVKEKDKAEQANRSKSDFLAHMSHELRTPLNSIIGFSDAANSEIFGPVDNVKYKDYFRSINKSGSLLLSLINDILELARLESGKFELFESDFDPVEPATEILYSLKKLAEDQAVTLESHMDLQGLRLHADSRRFQQILLNLLSNSLKFTQEGGTVRLEISPNLKGGIDLVISDTGEGMTEEEVKTAFEPFSQIERNAHVAQEGTGLGLPIVKSLVALHGATLDVQSEKGKGTVITISMPSVRIIDGSKKLALIS